MAASSTPFRRSLAIQSRVIGALLMREIITRYGRHNIGVLWIIVEPMLFTLAISGLWSLGDLHAFGGIPVIGFGITGYSSVVIWRNATNRCSSAIEPNLGLMHHRNVKVIDIFISRVLLEIIGATASITVLTIFFATIGAMQWPQDIMLILCGWLLLCWLAFAMGCFVGVVSEYWKFFGRVWRVVNHILFAVSGTFYMVDWLPRDLQTASLLLPMVHGVEMVRHGYFGQLVPTHEDPTYFVMANLFLTLVGLALVRVSERKGYNK